MERKRNSAFERNGSLSFLGSVPLRWQRPVGEWPESASYIDVLNTNKFESICEVQNIAKIWRAGKGT